MVMSVCKLNLQVSCDYLIVYCTSLSSWWQGNECSMRHVFGWYTKGSSNCFVYVVVCGIYPYLCVSADIVGQHHELIQRGTASLLQTEESFLLREFSIH